MKVLKAVSEMNEVGQDHSGNIVIHITCELRSDYIKENLCMRSHLQRFSIFEFYSGMQRDIICVF